MAQGKHYHHYQRPGQQGHQGTESCGRHGSGRHRQHHDPGIRAGNPSEPGEPENSCGSSSYGNSSRRCRCYFDQVEPFFKRPDWPEEVECARHLLHKYRHFLIRLPKMSAVDVGFIFDHWSGSYRPEVGVRIHCEFGGDCCREDWQDFKRRALKRIAAMASFDDLYLLAEDGSWERLSEKDTEVPEDYDKPIYVRCDHCADCERKVPVELLAARYQSAHGGLRTSPPIPNAEGFRDEAMERLGRQVVDPLVGGISIGNAQGSAGTLGAVVWDSTDGKPCILSNWHVLSGVPGSRLGDPCYQPALFDGGDPAQDQVGSLKRWILDRSGDAALAEIVADVNYAPGEILGLWLPIWEAVQPRLGMQVRKWGRASKFTEGFIDGIDMTVKVEYSNIGIRQYEGQFRITPVCGGEEVSTPGDSGAVWVTKAEIIWPQNPFPTYQEHTGLIQHLRDRQNIKRSEFRLHGHSQDYCEARLFHEDPPCQGKNLRAYFAVCLQFAGDVPGSTLQEHAVGSSLIELGKRLHFSFRPVFPHPDDLVAQPERTVRQRRTIPAARGVPTFQISTDEGRRSIGPQPEPDPVTGHP